MKLTGPLGLIAGKGELPLVVCQTAMRRGVEVSAVAFDKPTAKSLEKFADVKIFGLGQPGKVIRRFKDTGVTKICLIGKIEKRLIFRNIKLDMLAVKTMKKMLQKSDATIMNAIIDELFQEGMEVVKQTDWIPDLLPEKGQLGGKKPSKNIMDDFEFGLKICRELAGREIGQTIIVKEGVVLAVEAVEGTDAAIERGCKLGGKNAVMIKTSRPKQDLRFDIPSVGPGTIKILAKHKAAGLAVEAERTVVIDRPKTVSMCNDAGIAFTAL